MTDLATPRSAAEKRELLARLLESRAARPRQHPLSFAQERLWFLDRLQPGNPAYTVASSLPFPGMPDPRVLAAVVREVARRHHTLRTSFSAVAGRPVQVVGEPAAVPVPVVDLRALPPEVRTPEMIRLVLFELPSRAFDLARGPLLRVALLRMDRDHSLIRFELHHVIADGWSLGILVRELRALYEAFSAGLPSSLPELPIQYTDFVHWQRGWLQGERLESLLAWWRERLRGSSAVLELAADRPRPALQSNRGAGAPVAVSASLGARLRALGSREGVTPFMSLLAVFQILLSRFSGQEDLNVGVPVAGRNRRELEDLIGLFVNTLVLRGELAGDPPFRELLRRTREAALGAFAHQDVPFEKLVEALQPERDTSRSPLFQVSLVLQNTPTLAAEERILAVGAGPDMAPRATSKFDLSLDLADLGEELVGAFEYSTDLFDASTILRMRSCLAQLLEGAASHPEARLSELPLLAAEERDQLLAWNRARPDTPVALGLHELFALQARRRPGAVAVSCEGRDMTYAELDELSGRLAGSLLAQGVGPEVPVALCLERGPLMVAAILAVLKAGGAYVPVDPAYPRERQAWILEDSGARVVLTESALAGELPAAAAPAVPSLPQGLAYVIYTSGSTGRPKGVLVQHDHVVRLFEQTRAWFGFGEDDVWTLFHSYAFDFSVWEIWGALLHGGRLVVVPHAVSRSPKDFRALLAEERVTVLNQTPSAFHQLIAADTPDAGALSLRFVIFGGEALELQSLRPWIDRHGDREPRLINMYGITETTVHVTWRPVLAADLKRTGSPIGVAIPDLDLRVLDRSLALLPRGVPGELCVGGAGLARGYLGRPELTAERFVPDPFGTAPGARLYRSGDLARYRPDGDLEHLGRIDHQVKIRGFRIELGEIEAALCRHPAVAQAVVAAAGEGERRVLVAWVVPAPGIDQEAGPEPAELREHLRSHLPDYMLPASWMLLPSLPLTPSGKVDRKALPRPGQAATASSYEAPRSSLEHLLVEIWQELLGRERVGVHDNFFDLGGHSLLMVQMQSRITERLGREVSMVDLLSHASIDELARLLAREGPAGPPDDPDRAGQKSERSEDGKARLRQMRRTGRFSDLDDGGTF